MALSKEIAAQIKDVLSKNPQGISIKEIVSAVDINRNTAGRYLENLLVSGQVEMRQFGMAKIYTLSQRVPLSAVLSISSELVIQLDRSLRIIFANEPFLHLIGIDAGSSFGKNIEYTPVATVFDDSFPGFLRNIQEGVAGKEWTGEILLTLKDLIFFCRIAPTVFDDGRKGVSVFLQDITQRKLDEQKVEESERQFRLLAENSLDMISRIKPDGTRIYVSPAYKTTLGYEPEELIGKKDEFIHPDDARIMKSFRNTLTPRNSSATITFRTKHKDGHYIWIESKVKAIFDEKTRELSEYYTVTRDITERKKAEMLLVESEDRYRQLVDISPDGVIIHRDSEIIFLNPAALNLIGASRYDEITGKNILDFIHPDFRDAVRKNIKKDLGGDMTPPMELHMLRMDGTSIIVEGRGVKTNIDGKPAIQVALRDITERKRAEDALRNSEEKYRTLIDRANDGICVIQDSVIKMCNARLTEFWGGSIEEMLGKSFRDFIHPDALSEVTDRFNRRMAGETLPPVYETILKRRDGSRFHAELNAGLVSYDGMPANLIIIRDINDRKKVLETLRESEEKYRTLVDRANDVICIIQDGVIKMCNARLTEFWGGSIDEILGRPFRDFVHPDALFEVVSYYNRRMSGESLPSIYETILMRKDGSRSYVEVNAVTISYDGKTADLVIIRDMNERKKAQDALRESEATSGALINAWTDSVILMDIHGKILALNETAALRFGKRSDELVGILADDLLPKEIARTRRLFIAQVIEKRDVVRFEDERNGRWYDTVVYPITSGTGEVIKIAIIARDITERRTI
jgi:PAS domain S-box-containing protein